MSEVTYDDDLTPPQEYLIAGIVIALFGLLFWYLNYQPTHESAVLTASPEVAEPHKKADFRAEPVRTSEKVTPLAATPSAEQAAESAPAAPDQKALAEDTTEVKKAGDVNFQVKAPAPDNAQSQANLVQAPENTSAVGSTEKPTFIDLPESNSKEIPDLEDSKKNTYSLPNGGDVSIASEGFENDLKNALEPPTANTLLRFDNVYFQSGSALIDAKSTQQIKATAALLNTYPQRNILLRGHTDNTGEPGSNIQLSLARANEMGLALGRLGIKLERIKIIGVGDAEPIATNDTEEGRSQNRRIELLLLN